MGIVYIRVRCADRIPGKPSFKKSMMTSSGMVCPSKSSCSLTAVTETPSVDTRGCRFKSFMALFNWLLQTVASVLCLVSLARHWKTTRPRPRTTLVQIHASANRNASQLIFVFLKYVTFQNEVMACTAREDTERQMVTVSP